MSSSLEQSEKVGSKSWEIPLLTVSQETYFGKVDRGMALRCRLLWEQRPQQFLRLPRPFAFQIRRICMEKQMTGRPGTVCFPEQRGGMRACRSGEQCLSVRTKVLKRWPVKRLLTYHEKWYICRIFYLCNIAWV